MEPVVVAAFAAVKGVAACAAGQAVVAQTAVKGVVARAAVKVIMTADRLVAVVVAPQDVVAFPAKQKVAAVLADNQIAAAAAVKIVGRAVLCDTVLFFNRRNRCLQAVIAFFPIHRYRPFVGIGMCGRCHIERFAFPTVLIGIGMRSADQRFVYRRRYDAADSTYPADSDHSAVRRPADGGLNINRTGFGSAAHKGIAQDHIVAGSAVYGVRTFRAAEEIVVCTAVDFIVAKSACCPVAAFAAACRKQVFPFVAGMDNVVSRHAADDIAAVAADYQIGILGHFFDTAYSRIGTAV